MLASQVERIHGDSVLRHYGAALALVNAMSALRWLQWPSLAALLAPGEPAVCWPVFESCRSLRVLPEPLITTGVLCFLLGSLWNAWLFVDRARTAAAYWTLLVLNLAKVAIIAQDFRLTLNHHYMAGWVACAYLLARDKRTTITRLIVVMYVWAGILKLDPSSQWLSAAAFYGRRPLGLPTSLLPAACVYVIVLELGIVFGLLARHCVLFWASFSQVLLFHVASFWVVGWFYPCLMFALLAIFPLARASVSMPVVGPSRAALELAGTVILFSLLQLMRYAYPGRSSVTGQGRLFALNMFDAPVECRASVVRVENGQVSPPVALVPDFVNTRTMCDPIVFTELASDLCSWRPTNREMDFDLLVESRMAGERSYSTTVNLRRICSTRPIYHVLRSNSWIQTK